MGRQRVPGQLGAAGQPLVPGQLGARPEPLYGSSRSPDGQQRGFSSRPEPTSPPLLGEPASLAKGKSTKRRTTAFAAAGTVLVLLVAGAGTAAYATAGDVPRGSKVLGADLGGMTRAEARDALAGPVQERAATPVRVTVDGKAVEFAPADVALAVDVAATVEQAAKGGPRLFGSREVEPVVGVDAGKLEAVLRKQLDPKSLTIKKPGISYDGLTPKPEYPESGRDLDPAAAAELVRAGWLSGAVVDIPLVERPPATTREQVDAMITELAAPAVAGPVTVAAEDKSFTLTPEAIAQGLVFNSDDTGKLVAQVDGKKLRAAAKTQLARVEVEPKEASIGLSGGKPKISGGTPGTTVDTDKLAADLLAVLPATGERQVKAEVKKQDPETTAEDVEKLGIKEKVSTFTTRFPGGLSSPRSRNIVTIANEVDGALVKPGETFSLNGHTGVRSYAQGYQDAPVIINGKLEPGVGGGASQFTTTLFNAAYYAGLQDVEHKPHSFYFDRYPAVIEATIFYPSLDLKFKNTTPHGILIDTSHTGSTVSVTMWSTKYYDSVETERSPRRNITSPPTEVREAGPRCIATSGLPGFTQDAYRIIRKDGKQIKREKFTWKYDPEPRFICGGATP